MGTWKRYASGRYLDYLLFEALKQRTIVERDGFRLLVDRSIPRVNRRYLFHKFDRYEDDEVVLLKEVLDHGDRVLELGAGLGIVSLNVSRIVGNEGFLVSVEANHQPFEILQQNMKMNAKSYLCLEGLAGLEEGTERFFVNRRNLHRSSRHDAPIPVAEREEIEVARLSVPELVTSHRINALVMDIEGGEQEILEGFDLTGIGKLACEFHPGVYGKATMTSLIERIESLGFQNVGQSGDSVAFRRAPGAL